MRQEDFKMERPGLVSVGDRVEITEGKLPNAWYYTVEPAVAMSGNYTFREKIKSKEGIVKDIKETGRGFYITVEFDE